MPVLAPRETEVYRQDVKRRGNLLTAEEREKLIRPYLPAAPIRRTGQSASQEDAKSRFGVRSFFKSQLHACAYFVIHALFSLYIRLRLAYHAVLDRVFSVLFYHHRTPELIEKDVKGLSRLPKHISVVLKLEEGGRSGAGLEALVDEVAEIAVWCACAGIPLLSVYEKTGILKGYIPATHRAISRKLSSYFGDQQPVLSLRAPHVPSLETEANTSSSTPTSSDHISVLLLSADDGRDSIVDLTKTLTEMSQRGKITSDDITIDLVDAELSESVMGEPDLLLLFGPSVQLSGYPPWQIRLTEIFHVQDNQGVGYQVFLRALYNYANAQMRFGR